MKGLIRNNFYSVADAAKICIGFSILGTIVSIICCFIGHAEYSWAIIIGQAIAAAGLSSTGLQIDIRYKWSKFELTLPIKRNQIVTARYISFIIYAIIGICGALITSLLVVLASPNSINLERVGLSLTYGTIYAVLLPAFIYPMNLILGENKTELSTVLSSVIVTVLFLGSSLITPLVTFLEQFGDANVLFRLAWIVLSFILFIVSYFVSNTMYKNKEF